MNIFKKTESKIQIILKNGKKINTKGNLTTTKNWAIIENNNQILHINRQELKYIKENKGDKNE